MCEPVKNASTKAIFPESGSYWFWARTKDWIPDRPENPGVVKLNFDGKEFRQTFGINEGWHWIRSDEK
jgi:hypothetical protein